MRLILAALLFATPAAAQDVIACMGWKFDRMAMAKVLEGYESFQVLLSKTEDPDAIRARELMLSLQAVLQKSDTANASLYDAACIRPVE